MLLTAGVTAVAEAAFQDRVWRSRLQPLGGSADVRVVHRHVASEVAWARIRRRQDENPARRAHADAYLTDLDAHAARHDSFDRVQLDVPELQVDTSDEYRPSLGEIVAFAHARR